MNKLKNNTPLASRLLIHAARPVCNNDQLELFNFATNNIPESFLLSHEAEQHGLAPLLFNYLKQCGAQINELELKRLQIQSVRNRDRNRILMATLEEILKKFREGNIDVLVLKGGALCNLIYPDRALRPMRDLDILVNINDTQSASALLAEIGFSSVKKENKHHLQHTIPEMRKEAGGVIVEVDVHKNVFTNLHPESIEIDRVKKPLLSFYVGKQKAFTLGYEEMLMHLCRHMITPGQQIKLISVADIIGFVTRYVDKIDWSLLHKKYPFVIEAIRMLDLLVPLSDDVLRTSRMKRSKNYNDVGVDYNGWPNTSYNKAKKNRYGFLKLFYNSMSAPEWWLRLHYGYKEIYPIWFCRYVYHPFRLCNMAFKWLAS